MFGRTAIHTNSTANDSGKIIDKSARVLSKSSNYSYNDQLTVLGMPTKLYTNNKEQNSQRGF